jgi:peptidoglycan/LPS O-acetylase OafA/YrhL
MNGNFDTVVAMTYLLVLMCEIDFKNVTTIDKENVRPAASRERIIALDAIRVVAALIVLVQHFRMVFELTWPKWLTSGMLDDKAAVMLFFVLSGYVLASSLSSIPPSFKAYANFCVRRVLRLYPVYWAALLAVFIVLWNVQQRNAGQLVGLPAGYLDGNGLQLKQWLMQSTLVSPGMKFDFALPPVWTLMTEARVSIVFPLLAWAILRSSDWQAGVIIAALVLGSPWLDRHIGGAAALLGMFALGTSLCRVPCALWSKLNHVAWWSLTLLGLGLSATISFRYAMPSVWLCYYLSGLGSLILIAGAIHWPPMRSALTRLQNMLRVDLSYSIYILHYPVLVMLKKLSGPHIPASPLLAFSLALGVTFTLSLLLHFVIEKPAIELGRRLTRPRSSPSS